MFRAEDEDMTTSSSSSSSSGAAAAAAASEPCVESGDEVDVVSVPPPTSPAPRRLQRLDITAASSRSASVVRDLLVLPPACSLLARVTAMHNYSTQRNATPSSSSGRDIYSAPQSPSVSPPLLPPQPRADRRCLSTPASPSPVPAGAAAVRRSSRRRAVRRRARPALPPPPPAAAWESGSGSEDSDGGGAGGGHPATGGRRAHHNVLERRRRDHLKSSFDALRAVVGCGGLGGDAAAAVRMPKVAILRRARDHVRQLTAASLRLCAEYARLRCVHQRLSQRLDDLLTDDPHDAYQSVCTGGGGGGTTLRVQAAA